jgi:hypothetical protein
MLKSPVVCNPHPLGEVMLYSKIFHLTMGLSFLHAAVKRYVPSARPVIPRGDGAEQRTPTRSRPRRTARP